ncbi:cell wall-binding repeat-containing protein [Leifsonia poae]|uniref:cell wall-binding repeat-containing protein n=1 Tax=Leifsonia poae TaxID=110933 RepID=UPI003D688812
MKLSRILISVVAAGAVALIPAIPAQGYALHPLQAVGSIDRVAVSYSEGSDTPSLHVIGWAGDLADGSANGLGDLQAEFTVATPGGSPVTIGWAEHEYFAVSRPDVHHAYPQLSGTQGFDISLTTPATGPLTLCVRLWNLYATPTWAQVACSNVTVPAARPAWKASLSGSSYVGNTLSIGFSTQSPGPDTYRWARYSHLYSSGINAPAIPGATQHTLTSTVADVGWVLEGTVTTTPPGSPPIEQHVRPVDVWYPQTQPITELSGADRFATAVAASKSGFPDATAGAPVAFVASGIDFPDALSAGPAAAKEGGPLLLTRSGAVDQQTLDELSRLHPARIVAVGGPNALAESVLDQLRALPFAHTVDRLAGADRYATSRAVVDDAFHTAASLYLATGRAFPDALAAASAAAAQGEPVLLTDGAQAAPDDLTLAELAKLGTTHVAIAGGPVAISDGIAGRLASSTTVTRLAGGDRFGTSAAIAASVPQTTTVYIASGLGFPDALVVAPLSGRTHAPLVLSTGSCLAQSVLSTMLARSAGIIVALGDREVQPWLTTGIAACQG